MIFGFNPMRWNCREDGCFNKLRRPKIEVFAECFPRRINFGDVDGLVELNNRFCLLEWKGDGGSLSYGQRRSYEQFTLTLGNIVFVVNGNAETMEVTSFYSFWAGTQQQVAAASLDDVKQKIRAWARWVECFRNVDLCLGACPPLAPELERVRKP
jgi:hypothetical protein